MYEKTVELEQISIRSWTSNEVFSLGWFVLVGSLIVAYVVWLKLLDRHRGTELLLIGALDAVAKLIISGIVLAQIFGLYIYNIRILPMPTNVFASSVTLSPIIIMLVAQYTSSWKGFLLWQAIGNAFLNFVIFPIYLALGIFTFHNGWNVFYHFIVLYVIAIGVRVVYLWITGTEKRSNLGFA